MNEENFTSPHSAQPIICLNENLRVVAFNASAKEFFKQISSHIEVSSYFPDLFTSSSTCLLKEKLNKTLVGRLEKFHFKNGSSSYHLSCSPVLGVDGESSNISVVIESNSEPDLLDSEKKVLRAIIDNIPDYIFVKDRAHKSVLTNKKFYENILRKDREELGQTPLDYFEDEKGRAVLEDNEKVMRTGVPVFNRPDTVTNKHGSEERILLTKVPLKDENDNIAGLVGIARDVTSDYVNNIRRELTLDIVKSFGDTGSLEEALNQTLKILCKGLDFDFAEAHKVSLNEDKLIHITQWSIDDNLQDAHYKKEMDDIPEKVWKSGKIEFHSIGESDASQNRLDFVVGLPVIYHGKVIAVICLVSKDSKKQISTDFLESISLQIGSILQSKKSQDQFNDFFKYSLNLIAVLGLDGYIKMNNPSFEYKFGYSEEEILNIPFTEFIHPDDLSKVKRAIQQINVKDTEFEIRCRKKDGNYLWISWRFSRFFEHENVVYAFGTDITPIKEAYDELSEEITKRNEIQKNLELSEEKYKSLFEKSPLPMWVLDRDQLNFLSVNKAAVDLYGYSKQEFLNMTVRDLWAPDQEQRINKIVNANQNEFFRLKVRHLTKDGKVLYVSVKSNPLLFDDTPARVSLVSDITAMVKAEEKLLHSEKRFKALVQEGSDLISIVDCSFNYIYNSPASKYVFGLEPDNLKGTNFRDYIHKEDLDKIDEGISQLNERKRVQLPSYRIKNSRGDWRWIETIITNLDKEPAVGGIVMNSRDITEFIEQERKVIQSLNRYDIVSKATSDIITDYDIEKDEVTVNEAASKMLGFSQEEIGKSGAWWDDKIHPDDLEQVKSLARKMREEGIRHLSTEYRFRCADGSYKHILDRSYLLTDENNVPKRVIGSMQDITERKLHLIATENHNKRLKEIAWTQSHVVRAPLAKVMGLVDLLMNYKYDLEDTDEVLTNILKSANDLDKIVRQIALETEKEL